MNSETLIQRKPPAAITHSFLPNHDSLKKKHGRNWHDKAIDIYKMDHSALESIYKTGKAQNGISKEDLIVNN